VVVGRVNLSLAPTSGGNSIDHGGVYWDKIFELEYINDIPSRANTMLVTNGAGAGVKMPIRAVDTINNKVYFSQNLEFTPITAGDNQTEIYFGYKLMQVLDYAINRGEGMLHLNFRPITGSCLVNRYLANFPGFKEVQKYHSFNVRLGNLNLRWLRFHDIILPFVKRIRPTFTKVVYTDIDGQPILRYHMGSLLFIEEVEPGVIEAGSLITDEIPPIPADFEDLGD
jgi:hypothetical protein